MTDDEQLRNVFQGFAKGEDLAIIRYAKVISVNDEDRTVDCICDDDLEYYDVSLGLGTMILIPRLGSMILIGITENKTDAYLLSADEVDRIEINAHTDIIINSGSLGGLVKVKELTERINKIEKDINSLKNVFKTWVPVLNDSGTSLKTLLFPFYTNILQITQVDDIENKKIKQ